MNPQNNTPEVYSGSATYSPEDNKLRLYVGRVPREEYLKLRAEGWVTLHKQRDAGGGDFAATWTPSRRDTALEYAGIIEDEDMGPAERAADRAERFAGYRDKRTIDATGHADRYDSQPTAHGFQSAERADRAAARHDRIADRACDAWSKAEYWQRRTAGVIAHALYKSSPSVRMGRIKTLEAELRKRQAELEERRTIWNIFCKLREISDPAEQTKKTLAFVGSVHLWCEYQHPRPETCEAYSQKHKNSLFSLMDDQKDPISGAEAIAFYFSDNCEPPTDTEWTTHLKLRLAYENQMLEAQGGRAAFVEMVPGGKIGGKLIVRVNKSPATGRVVSVFVKGEKIHGYVYQARDVVGMDYSLHQIETERLPESAYTPPTPESLAELSALEGARKAAMKASKAKLPPCPLINPTDADAEHLQALWNERVLSQLDDYDKKNFKPSTVCRITQATYSANSKGSNARAESTKICGDGIIEPQYYNYDGKYGPAVCIVRTTGADGSHYKARRVIILTDKPQKSLPAAVWEKYTPKPELSQWERENLEKLNTLAGGNYAELDERGRDIVRGKYYENYQSALTTPAPTKAEPMELFQA